MSLNVNAALSRADFVWVDGQMFHTQYLRLSDEETQVDDVLIEAASAEGSVFFTKFELESAQDLGDGSIQMRSGAIVRFLSSATVH